MRWRRHTNIWGNSAGPMANSHIPWTCSPQTIRRGSTSAISRSRAAGLDDAQAQANAVMAAQPNNPDVHALLSAIAARRGQKDQALIEIQRAIELDPNRAAFHEDLALLQSADTTKAASVEDELKKAVALDPKSVNAKLILAAYYAKNNRLTEAEKLSWEAVATDPKSLRRQSERR